MSLGARVGCALALAATAGCATESPGIVSYQETRGSRFLEVRYTTTKPCEGRVLLRAARDEVTIRAQQSGPATDHRVLLPLPATTGGTYCVVLPNEEHGGYRLLPAASSRTPSLAVEQVPHGRNVLQLAARTDLPARWSATWTAAGASRSSEGPAEPASSALLDLGPLAASEELGQVRVEARFLDGAVTRVLPSVCGNARMAARLVEAVDGMELERLVRMIGAQSTTPAQFAQACESAAARTGLDALLDPALARAMAILADDTLDGPAVRLPFSYALIRLGNLDYQASLRGWPLPGRLARAGTFTPTAYPKGPHAQSHSIYDSSLLKALGPWSAETGGGGPQTVTVARAQDRRWLAKLKEQLVDDTPAVLVVFPRGMPLLAHTFEVQPGWLEGPTGFVRLQVDAGSLVPGMMFYLNLNDRAMLALRNRPDTYPGPALQKYAGGPLKPEILVTSWVECRIPAALLHAGTNKLVATAEAPGSRLNLLAWMLIRDLRIAPDK